MAGTPRPPSFLSAVSGAAAVRPANFALQPAGGPRAALRHKADPEPPPPPPPPGPSAEEIASIRAEAMRQVTHAVEILRLQAERLAEQARSDALEIGFHVARRVLETELSTSPDALFALIRSALKRAGESRRISVRLHPEDAKLVLAAISSDGLGTSAAAVEVAPDSSLDRGDCMVDTDFGKVDGRLRTRMEELHRAAVAAAEEGAA